MKWQITKVFNFEAGHRVWKQNLTYGRGAQFTQKEGVPQNKCVNLHGHSYTLEVVLGSDTLSEQDMVMDFYHVKNALKDLIDTIDHSFIIDINDPIYQELKEVAEKYGALKIFPVDFCPTAEALAKYFYDFLKKKLQEAGLLGEVRVVKVVLWETKTSKAEYMPE
ncbi:6-pyruvoyl trahydropterin synthase family protein [Hydrogenobacter hydrogenophilus]|uniref:6-carboxy-5,6,7,8-tetrahydropterin synthase n=1 Tax=Hydrogenobacter hydrogenophilus TaxID=35835 RepID=A0A285P3J8_9AQUI|nr:6-carboxytetrahydropterin synthase [Hydrogenobacter hydrogenophilus]SNZ16312.1 6-pyruvoyltetrahydropterin/6-carboxytetrahydropterin synthase [Hydrogenobacter hydrogenophilus]